MIPLRSAALILLPVITGLNGLIWSEVVASSGGATACICGAVAYLVVALGAFALGGQGIEPVNFGLLMALVALNTVTSSLWLIPIAGGTRYVSLALIEGVWPVFSILFAWILFGRRELDLTSGFGGALILIGAALVFHKA